MPEPFLALITPLTGGAPGSPSHPIHLPGYPDQGLPGGSGGSPSQPIYHPGHPDHGLPAHPSHPIAGGGGSGGSPSHPIHNPPYPDQGLPGGGGQPLPPEVTPPELPPELESQLVVLSHAPGQDWTFRAYPVGPDQGMPTPTPHG
jgi:hypothetical protein